METGLHGILNLAWIFGSLQPEFHVSGRSEDVENIMQIQTGNHFVDLGSIGIDGIITYARLSVIPARQQ